MKTAFSTARVHARDRLAYWREEASKVYVAHDFSTRVGRGFHGEISVASLGVLDLASFECDECLVERTQQRLAGANDDDMLLCRQVVGPSASTRTVAMPRPPPATSIWSIRAAPLRSTSAPASIRRVQGSTLGGAGAVGRDRLLHGEPMPAQAAPVTTLASEFLGMIAVRADAIDPAMGSQDCAAGARSCRARV